MKLTRFIPILIFVFSLLLPTAMVKAEEKSFVAVSHVYEGQKGRIVTISLYIHGTEKIAAGSLDLIYDQTALTLKSATLGDPLKDYLTSVNTAQDGKVSLAWAKGSGKELEGTLLTITASLKKANEIIDLDIENLWLLNEDASLITAETFDGVVKPFPGKKKTHSSKVSGDKQWTVRLNQKVSYATINPYTVKVKNSSGKEMPVNIQVKDQNTFTVSPKTNYARGTYTLEITEQIRGINGSMLREPIQYKFTVQ